MIGIGDDLGERLMRLTASCRSCGHAFSFEEGGRCARQHEINDKVVVCPHCLSCYRVSATLSSLTLLDDVTASYPQLASEHAPAVAPAAPSASPEPPAVAGGEQTPVYHFARPGCVTAYAVLLFIGAAIVVLGGVVLAGSGSLGGLETVLLLGLGGLELAIGVGLWRMREWARKLLIGVQVLGIAATAITALSVGLSGSILLSALIQVGISVYIIRWFVNQSYLFRPGA